MYIFYMHGFGILNGTLRDNQKQLISYAYK